MLPINKRRALDKMIADFDRRKAMGLSADGWFDWMIRDAGPLSKTNGGINTVRGVVPHSAEGYWPHLQTLLHSDARRASWAFSNLKDGRCFQHYSIYTQTWTSGAGYPNNNFVAWENEGVAGEALTDAQVDNIVRIIGDLSTLKGWEPSRPVNGADKNATMYEHNECVRWGAEPTACPSGRIPWERIMEELMGVTKEEFAALFVYAKETRDALYGLTKFVFGDKKVDDAEAVELLARIEKLEAADK